MIKLADFGLSIKIGASLSNFQKKIFGMVPYIDPKVLNKQKNNDEKSDIYSVGVLLWEISSGRPPFCDEKYDINLALDILQKNLREVVVPDTPEHYVKIYTSK